MYELAYYLHGIVSALLALFNNKVFLLLWTVGVFTTSVYGLLYYKSKKVYAYLLNAIIISFVIIFYSQRYLNTGSFLVYLVDTIAFMVIVAAPIISFAQLLGEYFSQERKI